MTLFAITLSSFLLSAGQLAFTLYVLLSFIIIARYTTRKAVVGRLIDGRAAPMSLSIPPSGNWLFIINVVATLLISSTIYRAIVLALVVVFLVADKIFAKGDYGVARAGGWLFIANVLALLITVSPLYMVLIVMGQAVLLLENRRIALRQFGLQRLSAYQLIRWSLLISGAVVVVVSPIMQLFQWALDSVHLSHPEQQSVEVFRQVSSVSQLIDFMIQAVILAPMIEELFFRGFLLTYFKNYGSTWSALIASAGIFAIAHQNLDSFLPLWILGIILGVAYEHTGCILLPMGIHACFNLTTGLSLLAQKVAS